MKRSWLSISLLTRQTGQNNKHRISHPKLLDLVAEKITRLLPCHLPTNPTLIQFKVKGSPKVQAWHALFCSRALRILCRGRLETPGWRSTRKSSWLTISRGEDTPKLSTRIYPWTHLIARPSSWLIHFTQTLTSQQRQSPKTFLRTTVSNHSIKYHVHYPYINNLIPKFELYNLCQEVRY